ncbi:uncharacterized protein FOMMEDRAFT_115887 [Fomitiporia mediterranea MF3/22]|uniref:uncharacterized protein n=1 Tax=Fomitiporia mediterranea (strain MF3/22) TaxID=694068 RepID=UPI0004409B90|nr:uncharacterized protein FOMMEDRAFT_115887 [Fomitiporia mediterranea MF3/22]EJD07565.1 hypothetical protein FOMMEDRAFT_115887 [Fomitiporia mediterranea MF3/22]
MSDFDEHNPFQTDVDDVRSERDSPNNSNVDLSSEPSTPPAHPARIPASPPVSAGNSFRAPQHAYKDDFCCARDRWLHSGEDVEIQVIDAQKTQDHASSPYIAYVIKSGNATAYHRYSEFESFRNSMVKLYPTLIIPPIPSKQTIGDYAVKQGKAKEDVAMIARRKRMLQTFLNRIARHPILSNEHVFHRFLEGEVSWTEIVNSPPVSLLPKNILKAPAHNPTDPQASPAYAALPSPSAAHPLRRPDQRFLDSEAFTNKFASHVSGPMEKVTRRTMKRWSEYAHDHSDLGAVLNGFSLNEEGQLAAAIEKTGQAIDATYISTTQLLQDLEQNFAEPLHEYAQFASIIKKLLMFRHQKHAQLELTTDALESKRAGLEDLERTEREASRLEEALGRGRPSNSLGRSVNANGAAGHSDSNNGDSENGEGSRAHSPNSLESPGEYAVPEAVYTPPHPIAGTPPRRSGSGMGLLNALSYTIHGMMDVDPETARRNGISKTRESISQLEDALHLTAQDVKYSSSTIQADLDRFQRQKVADIRELCLAMARSHRDWCKKNMEAWEEAKKEIALIPDHPNRIPEGVADEGANGKAGPSGPSGRRLSSARGL